TLLLGKRRLLALRSCSGHYLLKSMHCIDLSASPSQLIIIHLKRGDEGFLGNLDFAELAHLLLALFLLVEELALAADIAAIAFRRHVFSQRGKRLTGDHLAANGGLDRNLEHVARDQVFQLLAHGTAAAFGALTVDDHA